MSNRMQAFRLEPSSPNVLAGGKRPRTTLTPTVVLKDGKPFLAIGTPGGDSQDQQILLVLLNIIDFGLDVQAAIEAPRVNSLHPQSSFDDHRAQPGVLEVERTLAPDVLEELRSRGHVLRLRGAVRHLDGSGRRGHRSGHRTPAWRRRSTPRARAGRLLGRRRLLRWRSLSAAGLSTMAWTSSSTRTAIARSSRSTSGTTSGRRTRSRAGPGSPISSNT